MKAGFWLVRLVNNGPWTPARLYLCQAEPGEPSNILDRPPYWRGQIGLDEVDPLYDLWPLVSFIEADAAERQAMIAPPLSDRLPRGQREQALVTAPLAKWKQARARRITQAQWESRMRDWKRFDVDPRKPVAIEQLALPTFTEI